MQALRISGMAILFLTLLVSAIAVVYYQYKSRLLFIEIQQQQNLLDQYEVDWGKTQLEVTMLLEQNRIESVAINQLKLISPKHEDIVYLKP